MSGCMDVAGVLFRNVASCPLSLLFPCSVRFGIVFQAKNYADTVHSRSVKEFWMIQTGLTTPMREQRMASWDIAGTSWGAYVLASINHKIHRFYSCSFRWSLGLFLGLLELSINCAASFWGRNLHFNVTSTISIESYQWKRKSKLNCWSDNIIRSLYVTKNFLHSQMSVGRLKK